MEVVIIQQSLLAMSSLSDGSLLMLSECSKPEEGRSVGIATSKGDTPSILQYERQRDFLIINGFGQQEKLALCIGDEYTFPHHIAASDLSAYCVKCFKLLKEIGLLKVTKECVIWITKCKKLVGELQNVYEEQCSQSDEGFVTISHLQENSKSSRLLNLFERCRIELVGFKPLRRKVCMVAAVLEQNFTCVNTLKMLWSSMATIKLEILQAIGRTFGMEVKIFANIVSSFGLGQVDFFCKQISERIENLCHLFEKHEKLSLLLTTFAQKAHLHCDGTASLIYSRIKLRACHNDSCGVWNIWGNGLLADMNVLLTYIAKLRTRTFVTSIIRTLERLVRQKLLRRLSEQSNSKSSLQLESHNTKGPLQQVNIGNGSTDLNKTTLLIAKRLQKRFWHELMLVFEEEKGFSATVVNVTSSCLLKDQTLKRHSAPIFKNTAENPNGAFHLGRIWNDQGAQSSENFSVIEHHAIKDDKKVHFSDHNKRPERRDLRDLFMNNLWRGFREDFRIAFFVSEGPQKEFSILPRVYQDQELGFAMLTCLPPNKSIVGKNDISSDLVSCMTSLTTSFSAVSFVGHWDNCMQKFLPRSVKDRCRPLFKDCELRPLTQTGATIIACCQPLLKLANIISKVAARSSSEGDNQFANDLLLEIQFKCVSSIYVQLHVILSWFMLKTQQFLSSGSWELFFSLIKNDLNSIVTELEPLSMILTVLSQSVHSHHRIENYTHSVIERIRRILQDLKAVEPDNITKLINSIRDRSVMVWVQVMPAAKQWRKRGITVIPFEPSTYVELAATQILSPLMDTMCYLDKAEIESVFCKCVKVFIRTWIDYFLENEIKFSYYGAHQLRLDLIYFQNWLTKERPHFDQDGAAAALALPIFDEFDGVINLLCCQPQSRYRGSDSDLNATNSASSSSVSQGSNSGSANFEDIIRDVDIPNKQHWLMLRAKGSRKTRLLCLSAPE